LGLVFVFIILAAGSTVLVVEELVVTFAPSVDDPLLLAVLFGTTTAAWALAVFWASHIIATKLRRGR